MRGMHGVLQGVRAVHVHMHVHMHMHVHVHIST